MEAAVAVADDLEIVFSAASQILTIWTPGELSNQRLRLSFFSFIKAQKEPIQFMCVLLNKSISWCPDFCIQKIWIENAVWWVWIFLYCIFSIQLFLLWLLSISYTCNLLFCGQTFSIPGQQPQKIEKLYWLGHVQAQHSTALPPSLLPWSSEGNHIFNILEQVNKVTCPLLGSRNLTSITHDKL